MIFFFYTKRRQRNVKGNSFNIQLQRKLQEMVVNQIRKGWFGLSHAYLVHAVLMKTGNIGDCVNRSFRLERGLHWYYSTFLLYVRETERSMQL